MPRNPRHDPAGARHHVMNRGVDRMDIFIDARDRRSFLGLVGEALDEHEAHAEAYCLVGNHFHLVLNCRSGGLSEVMWKVGAEYARIFNFRYGRDGPLFRGRFRSKQIDSDEYLWQVVRYIHNNSLDMGVEPSRWKWSSYQAWHGGCVGPSWLKLDEARQIIGMGVGARLDTARPEPERPDTTLDPAGLHRSWARHRARRVIADRDLALKRSAPDLTPSQHRYALVLSSSDLGVGMSDLVELLHAKSEGALRARLQRARAAVNSDPAVAQAVATLASDRQDAA